jgi:hypothetical protein
VLLFAQDDRRAAARRKRAQARARQPQAAQLQPGRHSNVRGSTIADPLTKQRKRKAAAKDEKVQRIEDMLRVRGAVSTVGYPSFFMHET